MWAPLLACSKKEPPPPRATHLDFASPAADASETCADIAGDVRVCWGAPQSPKCDHGTCVFARPTPEFAISSLGFRCTGNGANRRCRDRSLDAPPFHCEGNVCTQRHPRMPDDGEWECAAMAGAVICRGGQPPAGVPRGPMDGGFFCGPRKLKHGASTERICVDFSPDFPNGTGGKLRCSFESENGTTRRCEPDPGAHAFGDACESSHPCIDGARCAGGRCVPIRPAPSCWLPADCDHGTCRFGTCTEDPT